MSIVPSVLIYLGILFWLSGTLTLLSNRELMKGLHFLGISDTLGSSLIVLGLLVRFPEVWRLLVLAIIAVIAWGPILTHMIARGMVWKGRR